MANFTMGLTTKRSFTAKSVVSLMYKSIGRKKDLCCQATLLKKEYKWNFTFSENVYIMKFCETSEIFPFTLQLLLKLINL